MSSATNWLQFAREDLRVAEWALDETINNQACFHSQQCVEKSLKAWLVNQGKSPPRVHQLATLLSLIPGELVDDLIDGIELLDQFYIPTRYPDALVGSLPDGLPSDHQASHAVVTARKVLYRVEQHISTQPSR